MKKMTVFLTTLFAGLSLQAGIYLEPYAGYNIGTLSGTVSGVKIDNAAKGVVIGARAGMSLPLFYVAADYSISSGLKWEIPGSGADASFQRLGATLGFTALPMFDIYGGYVFSSKLKVDSVGYPDNFSGSGFKVGVGLTMLPFISINAEYLTLSYGNETVGSATYNDFKETAAVVSVSLPLDL
ncbi:MAG: hypothetical protein D6797_06865 [Bdellovibrio sp.]|nr:MAG: hypothetical protein D6797_06865 [Bdellovibrio sp.]